MSEPSTPGPCGRRAQLARRAPATTPPRSGRARIAAGGRRSSARRVALARALTDPRRRRDSSTPAASDCSPTSTTSSTSSPLAPHAAGPRSCSRRSTSSSRHARPRDDVRCVGSTPTSRRPAHDGPRREGTRVRRGLCPFVQNTRAADTGSRCGATRDDEARFLDAGGGVDWTDASPHRRGTTASEVRRAPRPARTDGSCTSPSRGPGTAPSCGGCAPTRTPTRGATS